MSSQSNLLLQVFEEDNLLLKYQLSTGTNALEVIIKLHLLGDKPLLKFSNDLIEKSTSQLDFPNVESSKERGERLGLTLKSPSDAIEVLTLLQNELWRISLVFNKQIRSNNLVPSLREIFQLESIDINEGVISHRALNRLQSLYSKVNDAFLAIQQILIICQYAEKMQHKVLMSWSI